MSTLATSLASAGADVHVLSLNPRKHQSHASAPLPLESVDIDTSRRLAPVVTAMKRGLPYVVARFVSREFEARLRALLRELAPDVVQVESPFMLPYANTVRRGSSAIVALRSLNVEFRIWEGLAAAEPNAMRRVAYKRVAAALRKYELRAMNAVDAIVPITRADADDFAAGGVRVPMHVVPCGMEVPDIVPAPSAATVGFLGSLDYRPNQDAVRWIVRDLWPRVIARVPQARLAIAGSSPPEWVRSLASDPSIEFEGRVADSGEFLRRQAVVLAPLFAGGGMRIKVLEAMAFARPVVATTLGAGGVDVENGHDAIIADDVDSFAANVSMLLEQPELAARIGAAARETVAKKYAPAQLAHDLLEFYRSLRV